MYLTVHGSAAILIATKVVNPWWAFILAFISHFILDAIPHGDEKIFDAGLPSKKRYQRILTATAIDFVILMIYTYFIITKLPLDPTLIFIAILGAILPDILWGLYDVTNWKIFKYFFKLHKLFHYILKNKWNLKTGIIFQIIIVAILSLFIL